MALIRTILVCMNHSNPRSVLLERICGAYAHAVRSAFSGSNVKLGLYFARERDWHNICRPATDYNYAGSFFLLVLGLIYLHCVDG